MNKQDMLTLINAKIAKLENLFNVASPGSASQLNISNTEENSTTKKAQVALSNKLSKSWGYFPLFEAEYGKFSRAFQTIPKQLSKIWLTNLIKSLDSDRQATTLVAATVMDMVCVNVVEDCFCLWWNENEVEGPNNSINDVEFFTVVEDFIFRICSSPLTPCTTLIKSSFVSSMRAPKAAVNSASNASRVDGWTSLIHRLRAFSCVKAATLIKFFPMWFLEKKTIVRLPSLLLCPPTSSPGSTFAALSSLAPYLPSKGIPLLIQLLQTQMEDFTTEFSQALKVNIITSLTLVNYKTMQASISNKEKKELISCCETLIKKDEVSFKLGCSLVLMNCFIGDGERKKDFDSYFTRRILKPLTSSSNSNQTKVIWALRSVLSILSVETVKTTTPATNIGNYLDEILERKTFKKMMDVYEINNEVRELVYLFLIKLCEIDPGKFVPLVFSNLFFDVDVWDRECNRRWVFGVKLMRGGLRNEKLFQHVSNVAANLLPQWMDGALQFFSLNNNFSIALADFGNNLAGNLKDLNEAMDSCTPFFSLTDELKCRNVYAHELLLFDHAFLADDLDFISFPTNTNGNAGMKLKICFQCEIMACISALSLASGSSSLQMAQNLYPNTFFLDGKLFPSSLQKIQTKCIEQVLLHGARDVHKLAILDSVRERVVEQVCSVDDLISLLKVVKLNETSGDGFARVFDQLQALAFGLMLLNQTGGESLAGAIHYACNSKSTLYPLLQKERNVFTLCTLLEPSVGKHLLHLLGVSWKKRTEWALLTRGVSAEILLNNHNELESVWDSALGKLLSDKDKEKSLQLLDSTVISQITANPTLTLEILKRVEVWGEKKLGSFKSSVAAAAAAVTSPMGMSAVGTPDSSGGSNKKMGGLPSLNLSVSLFSKRGSNLNNTSAVYGESEEYFYKVLVYFRLLRKICEGRSVQESLDKEGLKSEMLKRLKTIHASVIVNHLLHTKIEEDVLIELLLFTFAFYSHVKNFAQFNLGVRKNKLEEFERADILCGRSERRQVWLYLRRVSGYHEKPIQIMREFSFSSLASSPAICNAAHALLLCGPVSLSSSISELPDQLLWDFMCKNQTTIGVGYMTANYNVLLPKCLNMIINPATLEQVKLSLVEILILSSQEWLRLTDDANNECIPIRCIFESNNRPHVLITCLIIITSDWFAGCSIAPLLSLFCASLMSTDVDVGVFVEAKKFIETERFIGQTVGILEGQDGDPDLLGRSNLAQCLSLYASRLKSENSLDIVRWCLKSGKPYYSLALPWVREIAPLDFATLNVIWELCGGVVDSKFVFASFQAGDVVVGYLLEKIGNAKTDSERERARLLFVEVVDAMKDSFSDSTVDLLLNHLVAHSPLSFVVATAISFNKFERIISHRRENDAGARSFAVLFLYAALNEEPTELRNCITTYVLLHAPPQDERESRDGFVDLNLPCLLGISGSPFITTFLHELCRLCLDWMVAQEEDLLGRQICARVYCDLRKRLSITPEQVLGELETFCAMSAKCVFLSSRGLGCLLEGVSPAWVRSGEALEKRCGDLFLVLGKCMQVLWNSQEYVDVYLEKSFFTVFKLLQKNGSNSSIASLMQGDKDDAQILKGLFWSGLSLLFRGHLRGDDDNEKPMEQLERELNIREIVCVLLEGAEPSKLAGATLSFKEIEKISQDRRMMERNLRDQTYMEEERKRKSAIPPQQGKENGLPPTNEVVAGEILKKHSELDENLLRKKRNNNERMKLAPQHGGAGSNVDFFLSFGGGKGGDMLFLYYEIVCEFQNAGELDRVLRYVSLMESDCDELFSRIVYDVSVNVGWWGEAQRKLAGEVILKRNYEWSFTSLRKPFTCEFYRAEVKDEEEIVKALEAHWESFRVKNQAGEISSRNQPPSSPRKRQPPRQSSASSSSSSAIKDGTNTRSDDDDEENEGADNGFITLRRKVEKEKQKNVMDETSYLRPLSSSYFQAPLDEVSNNNNNATIVAEELGGKGKKKVSIVLSSQQQQQQKNDWESESVLRPKSVKEQKMLAHALQYGLDPIWLKFWKDKEVHHQQHPMDASVLQTEEQQWENFLVDYQKSTWFEEEFDEG